MVQRFQSDHQRKVADVAMDEQDTVWTQDSWLSRRGA